MSFAVGSASVLSCVAVGCTIVTILSGLSHTVTTVVTTTRTTVIIRLISIITLLPFVHHVVTTKREQTIGPACIWKCVVVFCSVVTLFTAQRINNTIPTMKQFAI